MALLDLAAPLKLKYNTKAVRFTVYINLAKLADAFNLYVTCFRWILRISLRLPQILHYLCRGTRLAILTKMCVIHHTLRNSTRSYVQSRQKDCLLFSVSESRTVCSRIHGYSACARERRLLRTETEALFVEWDQGEWRCQQRSGRGLPAVQVTAMA